MRSRPTAGSSSPAGRPAARHQERHAAGDAFVSLTVGLRGERGLLGVAFDPDFASNQFVYVYYTATTPPIHNRISRFTANGDVALAGSEVDPARLRQPERRDQPQRRRHPLRARRQALRRRRRERQRRQLADARQPARQDAPASTPTARIPTDNPFYDTRPARTARSGRWACATPSPSPSSPAPGGCSSTTSARAPGRRSTTASPARTTAGRRPRARPPIPTFRSAALRLRPRTGPCRRLRHHRRRLLQPRRPASFPPSYVGEYFFADFCGGWINRYDAATGGVTTFATDISEPGRPDGGRRRQPLLPRARQQQRLPGVVHQLYGRAARSRRQPHPRGSHYRIASSNQRAADPVRAGGGSVDRSPRWARARWSARSTWWSCGPPFGLRMSRPGKPRRGFPSRCCRSRRWSRPPTSSSCATRSSRSKALNS